MNYPTPAVHAATINIETTRQRVTTIETRLELAEAANERHRIELAQALRHADPNGLATNKQVHDRGTGSGQTVIYSAHPDDPYQPPHSVETLTAMRKDLQKAQRAHNKANETYNTVRDETFDVADACAKADTRWYRVPLGASTPTRYAGQPIPRQDIEQLPRWEFTKAQQLGTIRELA